MQIVVTFTDRVLSNYANRLEALAAGSGRGALASALNEGGAQVRKQTVAAETAQTSLPADTLERAQHEIEADAGSLTYTIWSEGGNVRLKYFGAKEGGGGVTAHPWNRSTFYPGAFITSGPPGRRAPSPKLNGHVYKNIAGGKWGGSITQQRSGLFIPTEMVRDQTAAAFESGSSTALNAVMSRLAALLP